MKRRRRFSANELSELRTLAGLRRSPHGAVKVFAEKHGRTHACAASMLQLIRKRLVASDAQAAGYVETHAQLMRRLYEQHAALGKSPRL